MYASVTRAEGESEPAPSDLDRCAPRRRACSRVISFAQKHAERRVRIEQLVPGRLGPGAAWAPTRRAAVLADVRRRLGHPVHSGGLLMAMPMPEKGKPQQQTAKPGSMPPKPNPMPMP